MESRKVRKLFNPAQASLRQRLLLGMLLLAVPLMLISTLGYVMYVMSLETQEEMHHEITEEIIPAIELKALLLQAQMPANDYLVHGRIEERKHFDRLAGKIEAGFVAMRDTEMEATQKHGLLNEAVAQWQEARALSEAILALERPIGDQTGAERMERMDDLLDHAHAALAGVTHHGLRELAEQHASTHGWHVRAGVIMMLMFVLTAVMIIIGSVYLRNWIIAPLAEMQAGAERLGSGELGYRLPVLTRDEIGRVAQAFNAMATRLQKEHQALENLASHDALTGLLNVREFHKRLTQELERSARADHALCVLMLDIDHFKSVNDAHGHPAGDAVIREVATRINDSLRPSDLAGRYGGEEFIVLLPETEPRGATAMAERLRAYVASHPIAIGAGLALPVTLSIGVAGFPRNAESLDVLIATADHALYQAKQNGRNRVCLSDAQPPSAD